MNECSQAISIRTATVIPTQRPDVSNFTADVICTCSHTYNIVAALLERLQAGAKKIPLFEFPAFAAA